MLNKQNIRHSAELLSEGARFKSPSSEAVYNRQNISE
jgi:hypothetical protein